jgi:hypothetical protein
MATTKKPFAGKQETVRKSFAPMTSSDTKATFDARPKPSNDRRREDSVRPTQHYDRMPSDPLDADADTTEE